MIRFHYLTIWVVDIGKSKELFEILGLKFNLEKHSSGPDHYSCLVDNFVFELYPWKKESAVDYRTIRIGLTVPNLRSILDKLEFFCKMNELKIKQLDAPFRVEMKDFEERTIELIEGH